MTDSPKTDSYHHGQLRRALLDAALQLVVERGMNGFTMREVARQAGVSHAAPYHHFEDKSALVNALATECYDRFTVALRSAWQATEGSALVKFQAVGASYVAFAMQHSAEFYVMTRSELHALPQGGDEPVYTPLQTAATAAYQALTDGVVACQQAGFIPSGDPMPYALTSWATVHGLSMLLLDGTVGRLFASPLGKIDAQQISGMVAELLAKGLLARS